jgi:predicted TIM-barrel fold metal-dependent hydrolase
VIIDVFCHILPPRYKAALDRKARPSFYIEANSSRPALWDMDLRFRAMDEHRELTQILTVASPPVEYVVGPEEAVQLSQMANDEMAELVAKHPDRFAAAVASLPMNNIDAALKETDRAIKQLGFKGIQLPTSVNGKPLDSATFHDLYRKMQQYDLPVWIHPVRDVNVPDYQGEEKSLYGLFFIFGWPYETTLAVARLTLSGTLEKFPNLKLITHHCGAMSLQRLPHLYGDTAIGGHVPALMCGHSFFGTENMLFATDFPYGDTRQSIQAVNAMEISQSDKQKILEGNIRKLLRLPA